jgi:hypothetical protein
LNAATRAISAVVGLVLKPVTRAVRLIDSKPLFVAAARAPVGRQLRPALTAVGRAPKVVTEKRLLHIRLQAEIKKLTDLIRLCYRIAAEHVVLQDAGKCPMHAGIGGVTPAPLPEVRGHIVELPPGNCHLVAIGRINRNRALVRSIANDVLAILIDVDLVTGEQAELEDHPWRGLDLSRRRGGIIICFQ